MEFIYFLRRIVNKIMTLKQSALANKWSSSFLLKKIDIGVERKRGVIIRKDSGKIEPHTTWINQDSQTIMTETCVRTNNTE